MDSTSEMENFSTPLAASAASLASETASSWMLAPDVIRASSATVTRALPLAAATATGTILLSVPLVASMLTFSSLPMRTAPSASMVPSTFTEASPSFRMKGLNSMIPVSGM